MAVHALVTGVNISGRIPVPEHPAGWVDVTPHTLYFDHDGNPLDAAGLEAEARKPVDDSHRATPDVVMHVADAIEVEHYIRRTHPVEQACRALDDPAQYDPADPSHAAVRDQMLADHRAEHEALHAKMAAKGVTR